MFVFDTTCALYNCLAHVPVFCLEPCDPKKAAKYDVEIKIVKNGIYSINPVHSFTNNLIFILLLGHHSVSVVLILRH